MKHVLLALICSVLLLQCLCLSAQDSARPPNVVFVLADDLGWAELGCYGNRFNETPHLDRLAEQGLRFTQAYAAAPVCSPYRAALLTGQYPARVGILDYLRPSSANALSTDHVTLAEMLQRHGYFTGMIGKWHLTGYVYHDAEYETKPRDHGFAWDFAREVKGVGNGANFWPYVFRDQPIRWIDIPENRLGENEFLVDRMNREAVDFIQRNKDRPFFLYLSHYAPHSILHGQPRLVEKYRRKHPPGESTRDRCYLCGDQGQAGDPLNHWAGDHNPHLAAMLESVDHGIGLIAAKLEELGIARDTILMFTSDNGGETNVTSNAPLRGGKSQLYEGGIRVPLVVRWPARVPAGAVCDQPTVNVDFYPTLLEAAGIDPDPEQILDGVSTLPTWGKPALPIVRDAIYWHYPLERPHFLGGRSSGAIRDGDWKLIEFFDTGAVELYSLANDPAEKHDLAGAYPELVKRLKSELAAWRESVQHDRRTMPQEEEPANEQRRTNAQKRVVQVAAAGPVAAIDIGSRRELFVDDHLIESLQAAQRRLHHPTPHEIAILHDAPWEGAGSGYHSVIRDGDIYRLYYRGSALGVENGRLKLGGEVYCYAESLDGIQFTKPELGLHEHQGSKLNNIFWTGVGTHNFAPFLDTRAGCPAESRFKALGGTASEGGLFAFQSADGIHWSLIRDEPVVTEGAFDSQNLAFWDENAGLYRAYFRTFTEGVTTGKVWRPAGYRAIRTATSRDFLAWDSAADLTYEDSPVEHLYTNQIAPYFRAPHILIGFPTRYVERGWSDSMRALPQLEQREQRAAAHLRYGTALTEGLLMASRDGVRFERWNEAFLRPGPERPDTWLYGQQYIAWHAVETKSSLPGAPTELSLYASEGSWHGSGNALRRYTIRLDGFVSINAPLAGGQLVTKPLIFSGDRLTLNFATSAAGDIRIELQDAAGKPLPGYTLDDCSPVFGNAIERTVTWKDGPGVGRLAGRPVRLRFLLRDADLYAFRFVQASEQP